MQSIDFVNSDEILKSAIADTFVKQTMLMAKMQADLMASPKIDTLVAITPGIIALIRIASQNENFANGIKGKDRVLYITVTNMQNLQRVAWETIKLWNYVCYLLRKEKIISFGEGGHLE